MNWIRVAVDTTEEASEAVSEILIQAGAQGVEINDPGLYARAAGRCRFSELAPAAEARAQRAGPFQVCAYFPEDKTFKQRLSLVKDRLQELPEYGLTVGRGTISCQRVKEADWANAWKDYYHALHIGEKFVICPRWEEYSPAAGERVIRLDPGMAFGTGDHPTTALCLEVLERTVRPGDLVADVGTGSGVLAIGAAMLGAERVVALDIDPVAVKVARENVGYNGREEVIDVKCGTVDRVPTDTDVVVANIVAEVIINIAPRVWQKLRPGGVFIASGIVDSRRDQVLQALRRQFAIEDTAESKGWVCITGRKNRQVELDRKCRSIRPGV